MGGNKYRWICELSTLVTFICLGIQQSIENNFAVVISTSLISFFSFLSYYEDDKENNNKVYQYSKHQLSHKVCNVALNIRIVIESIGLATIIALLVSILIIRAYDGTCFERIYGILIVFLILAIIVLSTVNMIMSLFFMVFNKISFNNDVMKSMMT